MPTEYIVPGSAVLVGLLSFLGVVIVNKTRKPVATQDLWEENRQLRNEVRQASDRIDLIETKFEARDTERQRTITLLGAGFDVLWHLIERLRDSGVLVSDLSAGEQQTVNAARALRTVPIPFQQQENPS